jgi:toxin ParE1/3/4
MKIIWSPLAVDRASEIVDYIAQDKPTAAKGWINEVFKKVEKLESSPQIGRAVPEISDNHYSFFCFLFFISIYQPSSP